MNEHVILPSVFRGVLAACSEASMSTTKIEFAHEIEMRRISSLRPYSGNARTHSKKQIRQIADSIQRFGFTNPVLVSDDDEIMAGHGRVMAAKELGLTSVPTLKLSHLSAAERRAYVLADNKLAMNAGWDNEILATELQALIDIDFDISLTVSHWRRWTSFSIKPVKAARRRSHRPM
jgi:hypothetical protein